MIKYILIILFFLNTVHASDIVNITFLGTGTPRPNINKVSKVTWDQVKAIAEDKMVDLNAFTVESAMKMVAGTARSMGINVKGGKAPE